MSYTLPTMDTPASQSNKPNGKVKNTMVVDPFLCPESESSGIGFAVEG